MTDTQAVHTPLNTENLRRPVDPHDGDASRHQPERRHFRRLAAQPDGIGGGIFASKIAKSRTVTVAIEAMNFRKPVFVGDVVPSTPKLVRIGKPRSPSTSKPGFCAARKTFDPGDRRQFYLRLDRRSGTPASDQAERAAHSRVSVSVMAGRSRASTSLSPSKERRPGSWDKPGDDDLVLGAPSLVVSHRELLPALASLYARLRRRIGNVAQ